eukprot:314914-Amphidinium_carterae.1
MKQTIAVIRNHYCYCYSRVSGNNMNSSNSFPGTENLRILFIVAEFIGVKAPWRTGAATYLSRSFSYYPKGIEHKKGARPKPEIPNDEKC